MQTTIKFNNPACGLLSSPVNWYSGGIAAICRSICSDKECMSSSVQRSSALGR